MNPPLSVVVFGEPRPFYVQAANLLAKVPERSYLNMGKDGHDCVWDLPIHIPGLFEYVHGYECQPTPRIPVIVSEEPGPGDPEGIFRYHHSSLYRSGIGKLPYPLTLTALPGSDVGITDMDAINFVYSLYQYPDALKVEWDHYDDGSDDGVCWAAKKQNGIWAIVNRGTANPKDILRDLYAAVQRTRDIGRVHAGFYQNAQEQHQEIVKIVGNDPVMFTGHSLGAARAQIQAAEWCAQLSKPVFTLKPAMTGAV